MNFSTMLDPKSVSRRKGRWAVWIDGRHAAIVSSRRDAKKICTQANLSAYFCKAYVLDRDVDCLAASRITDLVVWHLCSNGRFSKSVWLYSPGMGDALPCWASRHISFMSSRYGNAVKNSSVWKVSSKPIPTSLGIYPVRIEGVTWDSDDGMWCGGYQKIAVFSSPADFHAMWERVIEVNGPYYGTVSDGCLNLWVMER